MTMLYADHAADKDIVATLGGMPDYLGAEGGTAQILLSRFSDEELLEDVFRRGLSA